MKRNLYVLFSLLVLASMILAACGGAAAPAAPTFKGTVTITFTQEPDNLNPMYTDMSFSGYLRPFYLKPSWDFDENAKPVPVLAKEIPSAMYEEERMFREISNSLLVYKNNNPGHAFSEVFCSAPMEEMKDFRGIVAEATEMEPSRLHAADFVSGGNGVFCDGNTLQSLSPALGAAMRNL